MALPRDIEQEYKLAREEAVAEQNKRIERVREICPKFFSVSRRAREIIGSYTRPIALADEAGKRALIAKRDDELSLLRAERNRLLTTNGLPVSYLEAPYRCKACSDTGYVNGAPCDCLKKKLLLRRYSLSRLDSANCFGNFDLDLFKEGRIRRQMERLRDFSMEYAEDFPNVHPKNIIFQGPVGVGKTYLSECIGNRVLERGYTVVKVAAYTFINSVLASIRGGAEVPTYTEPDLLIIDDLGTEPQIPNITVEQLFCVINERCELNKGTVFATNLTPRHIEEMYGERIFSRLTAKSLTIFITIEGSDIRGNKNTAV